MAKYKIFIMTIFASGHLNPLLPILRELISTGCVEIIVYAPSEYKKQIESTGAQLRTLIDDFSDWRHEMTQMNNLSRDPNVYEIVSPFLKIASKNTIFLANEIENEKPDLIVIDTMGYYAKWACRYYSRCYELAKSIKTTTSSSSWSRIKLTPSRPLPTVISLGFFFSYLSGIYPNDYERQLSNQFELSLRTIWGLLRIFLFETRLCFKFNLKFNSIELRPFERSDFIKHVLITVLPDLQPRAQLFDHKIYKFVGSTVDECFIDERVNEELYKNLFDLFPIKYNHQHLSILPSKSLPNKLVFAAFGTVVNDNLLVYKKIIEAFKSFDDEASLLSDTDSNNQIKLSNLTVVVSTGAKVYDEFNKLIKTNQYFIPSNIILVKSAPQIEILKRASLFISHCGMNSTSESVHFGVPMICVPVVNDQPFVAYRVADELGLGIRLDYKKFKSTDIRRAAHKILTNELYESRAKRFSQLSRECNGFKNATKIIIDLLNKNQ